jgi:hypothetical protein
MIDDILWWIDSRLPWWIERYTFEWTIGLCALSVALSITAAVVLR